MTDPIRMTVEDLCKAVAEEMGIEDAWWCPKCKDDVDGCHVTYQEIHETCGCPVIDSYSRLATGDGMLEVLDWLQDHKSKHYFAVKILSGYPTPRWIVGLDENRGKRRASEPYNYLPTAVLLAFMKAVKGVDVELAE